jgi:hypothetical protein
MELYLQKWLVNLGNVILYIDKKILSYSPTTSLCHWAVVLFNHFKINAWFIISA